MGRVPCMCWLVLGWAGRSVLHGLQCTQRWQASQGRLVDLSGHGRKAANRRHAVQRAAGLSCRRRLAAAAGAGWLLRGAVEA